MDKICSLLGMEQHFISTIVRCFPIKHIGEVVLELGEMLLTSSCIWHVTIFPDKKEMDLCQVRVSFYGIACDRAWKRVPSLLL